MQIRAEEIGRPISELMRDVIDYALDQNWVYSLTPTGVRRYFSNEQEAFFADVTGKKDFTPGDIVTAFRARKNRKQEQETELVEA